MHRGVIVMSGYPGSGKSTLAARLAEHLGFALLSKDALLMTLYEAFQFGPGDAAASVRTGAAAWAVFWRQAALCPQVVLDANIEWANEQQLDLLRALGPGLIEVHCACPLELAMSRYAERARLGHAAQRYLTLDEARAGKYARPLNVGRLVEVDTSVPVVTAAVAEQVEGALAQASR
jgi:predicted kinase